MIEKKNKASQIAETTLSIYFNLALTSYKDVQYQPVARNIETTKQQRIQYRGFFDEIKIDSLSFILINWMFNLYPT